MMIWLWIWTITRRATNICGLALVFTYHALVQLPRHWHTHKEERISTIGRKHGSESTCQQDDDAQTHPTRNMPQLCNKFDVKMYTVQHSGSHVLFKVGWKEGSTLRMLTQIPLQEAVYMKRDWRRSLFSFWLYVLDLLKKKTCSLNVSTS